MVVFPSQQAMMLGSLVSSMHSGLTAVQSGQDPWLLRVEVDTLHALAAREELALYSDRHG